MDCSLLNYHRKSHRKVVSTPKKSKELAELLGIIFGDGGITDWQLVISLNSDSDAEYSEYIIKLLKKLFKIEIAVRKRPNQNTLTIVCSGKNLVEFLVRNGSVIGNKVVQQIDVPDWINNNRGYQKLFVRGLVDTDGCLYIHNHFVNNTACCNIGFCLTNSSKKLILSVAKILKEFGIKPHITDEGRRIYLYSFKDVNSYLNIFGSSNPRIFKKYLEWLKIKTDAGTIKNGLDLNIIWRDAGVV